MNTSFDTVLDAVGLGSIAVGALLCLAAAIGIVRLPDLYSRMHAATKPQTLGLILVLLGLGLRLRSPLAIGMLLLVAIFQMVTIPVSAHLISRARYRIDHPDDVRSSDDESQDAGRPE